MLFVRFSQNFNKFFYMGAFDGTKISKTLPEMSDGAFLLLV